MSKADLDTHVARARVTLSKVAGRTLVQISGLDEDTHDLIELLLPPGYVASPVAGSDCLEVHVLRGGSHKVALGGDNTADAVANLQPGECGLSRGGQLILLRLTGVNVVTPMFQWGLTEAAMRRLIHEEALVAFNGHTHNIDGSVTLPPNQQWPDSYLTGGT